MTTHRQFPCTVTPKVPPIKIQGIKTKLVSFILKSFQWDGKGYWIEPFMGSGVVLFNASPQKAIVADTNEHIIRFYKGIQEGTINARSVRQYLLENGDLLRKKGAAHYYFIRDRFNSSNDSLDFLFLNRSCFNGVMRFNGKGNFNVPYCKKDDRFRQSYITKIVNQVDWVASTMAGKDWTFLAQDWRETVKLAHSNDFLYLDPPYIGRHTDYFNQWLERDANALAEFLCSTSYRFAYSMWKENKYRENTHLAEWFSGYPIVTQTHFYHVGPNELLRNHMEEALVLSPTALLNGRFPDTNAKPAPLVQLQLI